MQPAKLIDLTGQLQIRFVPATLAVAAQARVILVREGKVAAQSLIPATQMDGIVQGWRRARLEFPKEETISPLSPQVGSPLLPTAQALLQQLQQLEAIESALGDTDAAEQFCEGCRIDDNIIGNRQYQEAFWYCNASEHLGLAIGYLSKILDLEN